MRSAKVRAIWEAVYRRDYPVCVNSVEFTDISGLGTGSITFRGGLTAICGANGVGKSTLLDALLAALDVRAAAPGVHSRRRLQNARLTARVRIGGSDVERRSSFDSASIGSVDAGPAVPVAWLDVTMEALRLIREFGTTQNLDEMLEAHAPKTLNDADRSEISYLVNRDYQRIEVYELEEFDEARPVPYFRVRANGVQYGSESMGTGELSLHLLLWHVRHTPPSTILLVEEPEAFVSPGSQVALTNLLAHASVQNDLWIILTTHSPSIVAQVPTEHVRLVVRDGPAVQIVENPPRGLLEPVLGVPHRFAGIALVEDRAAADFLRAVWERIDPELLVLLEIVVAGSDGAITQALKKLPQTERWFTAIGIFDGDADTSSVAVGWPFLKLPSPGLAPEAALRHCPELSAAALAEALGSDRAFVAGALGRVEGVDHHDWFEDLAGGLRIRYEHLMRVLTEIWLRVPENAAAAREFSTEVRAQIRDS